MLWVGPLGSGGDLFGTTPTVQDDFAWVIVAIVARDLATPPLAASPRRGASLTGRRSRSYLDLEGLEPHPAASHLDLKAPAPFGN